jgi:MoxR-like ATPase
MVNAALLLHRPLLVTGRPGVGKSSLIYSVAYQLDLGPVLEWPVTSRTMLQHGLYSYDAIGRLQEAALLKTRLEVAQLRGDTPKPDASAAPAPSRDEIEHARVPPIGRFIQLGALGTALLGSSTGRPRALLIDEFDKADIDLPNDLLHVFEEGRFRIPELGRRTHEERSEPAIVSDADGADVTLSGSSVECRQFPFVVITSNAEREFPSAFLRRCLRLDLDEPNEEDLKAILRARLNTDTLAAEIEQLARTFVLRRDGLSGAPPEALSTDQLINAAFVVLQGGELDRRPELRDAILRALSSD